MRSMHDKIWESALKSIQVRQMSRSDLKRKLITKFADETAEIDLVLDEMERVQLLNDKRYAEQLINHLTQRPIGRLKLMNEARKRGLDSDMVQGLLVDLDYNEESMAKQAFEVKEKTISEDDPRKRKQKLMMFMRGRGFTNAVIYSVLK